VFIAHLIKLLEIRKESKNNIDLSFQVCGWLFLGCWCAGSRDFWEEQDHKSTVQILLENNTDNWQPFITEIAFFLRKLNHFDTSGRHYPNLNFKLMREVWIPVAFLMRLAMKMTLENLFSSM
jgi:hypothetical protein